MFVFPSRLLFFVRYMSGSEDEASVWEAQGEEAGEGGAEAEGQEGAANSLPARLLWHESNLVFAGEVRISCFFSRVLVVDAHVVVDPLLSRVLWVELLSE